VVSVISILGLALVDSLSVGTLVIPLALVLNQRRVKVRPLTVYFATISVSYFLLGAAILLGLVQARGFLSDVLNSDPALCAQILIGAVLLLYGVLAPSPKSTEQSRIRQPRDLSTIGMMGLAFSAVVVEAATMIPYLAALAILSNLPLGNAGRLGVLAVYCLVMILPASIAITVVARFGDRIWAKLEQLIHRFENESKLTIRWMIAIIGVYLMVRSVNGLGLL
jgi:hypothetical protein